MFLDFKYPLIFIYCQRKVTKGMLFWQGSLFQQLDLETFAVHKSEENSLGTCDKPLTGIFMEKQMMVSGIVNI